MRTVVVTGASGSLGRRVLLRLGQEPGGAQLVALDAVGGADLPPDAEIRRLDLAGAGVSDADMDDAFSGADSVVHLAWRLGADPGPPRGGSEDVSADNHRSLERVLAAADRAGLGAVVVVSSATVYGAWPDNPVPLTEEAALRPNPELAFAVGKADAERAVADWADRHPEVAVAVLRPAAVVGGRSEPLYRALGGTGGPRGDDAGRRVQFVHVDDLAAAVVLAWRHRLRGPFNVAPDSGTPEQVARALAGGVARLHLPGRAAAVVASWGWGVSRTGVPKAARAYATYSWAVAPDRLKAAGWVPRYTSEEALVAADAKSHWDDLPPGKRQNYTVLAAGGGVLALIGGLVGAGWLLARRGHGPLRG